MSNRATDLSSADKKELPNTSRGKPTEITSNPALPTLPKERSPLHHHIRSLPLDK